MNFEEAYAAAQPYTLVSREKCEVLWREAQAAPPGDFVELGVYKGGSAMVLRAAAPARWLHVFDTFTGHPPARSPLDSPRHHEVGRFGDTSRSEVLGRLGGFRVRDWPGDIRYTGLLFHARVALAHVDVDLYESTRAAIEMLGPLVVSGGAIIFDDYSDDDCPGAAMAVHEKFTSQGIAGEVLPTGQFVVRRP